MSAALEKSITSTNTAWIDLCGQSDLVENSGVCALLPIAAFVGHSGSGHSSSGHSRQVAIFYIPNTQSVHVVSNWDPIGKVNVMYRGIIGSIAGETMVSSPLYKQHFSLSTGKCFEQDDVSLLVYPSRIVDGKVQVSTPICVGDK